MGETASGKSALAIKLAQKFNGEILCADSWSVRREMNIGTAKPSLAEQALVRHHLLDIVDPDQEFTAAIFKKLAQNTIQEITSRGKLPILVGGTGLYIDGVIYDYSFLSGGNRQDRVELNNKSVTEIQSLVRQKGISLDGIDVNNKRRLIRLLETNGERPSKASLRTDTLIIGLITKKDQQKERITNRVDKMIKLGLEKEVSELVQKYSWDCEGLKGIGYKEWQNYFKGTQTIEQTRQKIIKSTQDLAKRQRTWFKRNKSIQWTNHPSQVVDLVTTYLNKIKY